MKKALEPLAKKIASDGPGFLDALRAEVEELAAQLAAM